MDYKELIDKLREDALYHENNSNDEKAKYFEVIATAIETLMAERDAAVEHLRRGGKRCLACIYNDRGIHDFPCNSCKETGGMSDYWEWSIPQEGDNSGS